MERVILHSDLNSFYASVECLYNPQLRGKPVSVCGSVDLRHGIVLASTPEAKRLGVRTGDAVWQAKQKCKDLIVVEPHMEQYVRFSRAAREIYARYSPCVEPYGLDENWLDLTGTEHLFGSGREVADRIRRQIREELGVTVSIGVSFNKTIAKLGSDFKKPDATTVITRDNFESMVWPLPASDLLFVGPATTAKLKRIGIQTIGQLAKMPVEILEKYLGVYGRQLWRSANGKEDDPVTETGYQREVKSIGNSTTAPRDLETKEDIRVTTMLLAESVAERLREKSFRCQVVQVSLRYANMAWYQRQAVLSFPSCTAQTIGDTATHLILDNWTGDPLRGIGVRGCNLITDEYPQLSLLPEVQKEQRQEALENSVQDLRRRFGHFSVQRGTMVADKPLSGLDTRNEASPQSVAFYRG